MARYIHGMSMETRVDKAELLAKLRHNRDSHASIVREARNGYIAKAKEALEKKLELLQSGVYTTLAFSLTPPKDYTEVYDVAIRMLEMNQDISITLTAEEFRNLVLDEWEWTDDFCATNSLYTNSLGVRR